MKYTFALSAVLLTSISFSLAQSPLGLGIKKGQAISTSLVSGQTMEMGAGMEMKSDVQSEYQLSFADLLADSLYTIHTTFTSLKATADGMGQSQKYDSKTGEGKDSELGSAFQGKIGKTDTIILNRYSARVISKGDSAAVNPMAALNNNTADISSVIENLFFILPRFEDVPEDIPYQLAAIRLT